MNMQGKRYSILHMQFIPPRSGYGLIQEDLWPDEWKILVSCMMLNYTSRKQVEKILPSFFKMARCKKFNFC